MKSLRSYLTESVRTYRYTIKIAGDIDNKFMDMFKYNLQKFDPVKIEEPKTTPIQKNPYGFTDAEPNQSVTIIKTEFRYPATEPMIQQMAQLLGKNINTVRVITSDYADSINADLEAAFAHARPRQGDYSYWTRMVISYLINDAGAILDETGFGIFAITRDEMNTLDNWGENVIISVEDATHDYEGRDYV